MGKRYKLLACLLALALLLLNFTGCKDKSNLATTYDFQNSNYMVASELTEFDYQVNNNEHYNNLITVELDIHKVAEYLGNKTDAGICKYF